MKTETKIVITFEEGDLELLNKEIPNNPCDICSARGKLECCGCSSAEEYQRLVKPYKDRDIYEVALSLKRKSCLAVEAEKLLKEITKINDSLPEEAKNINFR